MKNRTAHIEKRALPLTRLFDDLYEYIPEYTSGTYNRADPTCYSKGRDFIRYKPGLWFVIEYNDITWGIEFTLTRVQLKSICDEEFTDEQCEEWIKQDALHGFFKCTEIGNFYDTREDNKIIIRQRTKGLLSLLYRIKQELKKRNISKSESYEQQIDADWGLMKCYI